VEERPFHIESEPSELEAMDIGVLPQPDDPWTRGKAAFKALLYMATGLPVVASSGGVNTDVVRDGETGFCVDGAAGWVAALDRLAGDPALRQRMGDAGRERVERHYSLRVLAPRFAEILRRAARGA
jgi:glycosyltransferase involved in cell wall biosynthesis